MKLKLNKYDIIITIIILIVSIISLIFVLNKNSDDDKIAKVFFHDKLIHTFDLSKLELQKFETNATNGLVKIEAKDGKVRVVSETSRRNLCSIQGWSNSTINPIVCLPNNLYIKIESKESDDVDVFIK